MKVAKDTRGNWSAETVVHLGNNRELTITTAKRNVGISTHASVSKVDGHFRTHAVFQDYSKTLRTDKVRATERNIREYHQLAVDAHLGTVLAQCKEQYGFEVAA